MEKICDIRISVVQQAPDSGRGGLTHTKREVLKINIK